MDRYIPFKHEKIRKGSAYAMKDNVFDNTPRMIPFALMEGMRGYLELEVKDTISFEKSDDITQRAELQLSIDAARERFRQLAEHLGAFSPGSVILSLQLNGQTVTISPEALRSELYA